MDWSPFVVCPPEQEAPRPRGFTTPEGLGDRLRVAAFAEKQAEAAFHRAAERFEDAPPALREAWRRIGTEEGRHLGMILERMEQLGVAVDGRPVSDRLWRSLEACGSAAEFVAKMRAAEERGRTAEESFRRSLAQRDPATAELFGRIADDEAEHLRVADGFAILPK
ncbi:MAG: ferritin-like domain-containing protein [Elusimicrobiota bacterium]|nr:ferritin-like domain-containing protein [Elusimicrobiota bacterium]